MKYYYFFYLNYLYKMDENINLDFKYLPKYPKSKKNYHLEIDQKEHKSYNNFKFDINDFIINIENYNIKIKIDLCILNKEFNFIYKIKNCKIEDISILEDEIIKDYTGNDNYLINYYDSTNIYKLYKLKFIDFNNDNYKIIYKLDK